MVDKLTHNCKLGECNVEKDGKCLKGHEELATCPNYISAGGQEEKDPTLIKDSSENGQDEKLIDLPTGKDLDDNSMLAISIANLTRIIVIAGPSDSGKTTLIASIYEKFGEGSFAGYSFAGSDTLKGFEFRCFLSRIDSGEIVPDTERTKAEFDKGFLHLRVRANSFDRPPQDLLFSDISGETYRKVRDYEEECKKLTIIKYADHLVLTLDGDKLRNNEARQEPGRDAINLLRRFIQTGMIDNKSMVDVLITKYDQIKGEKNESEVEKFLRHTESKIRNEFDNSVGQMRFFRVAARPTNGRLPNAYGFDNIFPSWVEETPIHTSSTFNHNKINYPGREFDRYLFKYLRKN